MAFFVGGLDWKIAQTGKCKMEIFLIALVIFSIVLSMVLPFVCASESSFKNEVMLNKLEHRDMISQTRERCREIEVRLKGIEDKIPFATSGQLVSEKTLENEFQFLSKSILELDRRLDSFENAAKKNT